MYALLFALVANVEVPATLTLEGALQLALRHQPRLDQARAALEAAQARADLARSELWPRVSVTAQYQRTTANFAPRPGALPQGMNRDSGDASFDTFNYFNFGVSASQLVWDFGQASGRHDAAEATAESQAQLERTTRLQVALEVRTAFFDARAQHALLEVARETLANQERHLKQIEGFVEVGTRPQIDVAQARTDVANARVQLINVENAEAAAKAQLNRAMGIEGSTSYQLAPDTLPAIDGEDLDTPSLFEEALRARPEFVSLEHQARAARLTLDSLEGSYWPSVSVSTGLSEAGTEPASLAWNWNAGVALSWPIYEGGATKARLREASATLANLDAQVASLRQQVRVELEQARIGVRAAKAVLVAADEVVANAKTRLQLAEGRYETGVGSVIELGDAQLAQTSAQAQRVQADYNLAASRARLLLALGRE